MLDEAGRLDIVGVVEDELVLLRRVVGCLAEIAGLEGAVDQRHRHRLALAMAEDEAVAAGELRWHLFRALELVDHLAFGQGDVAEIDREAELLRHELD